MLAVGLYVAMQAPALTSVYPSAGPDQPSDRCRQMLSLGTYRRCVVPSLVPEFLEAVSLLPKIVIAIPKARDVRKQRQAGMLTKLLHQLQHLQTDDGVAMLPLSK